MRYRTNWPLVIGLSFLLHGALLGGVAAVQTWLSKNMVPPSTVSENLIPLDDVPDMDGEKDEIPGTEDGADKGSLQGEVVPEMGMISVSEKDMTPMPEFEKEVADVKEEVKEEAEPLTQEDVPEEEVKSEEPIEAETEEEALKEYQKQLEAAKKDPRKKVSNLIVIKKKGSGGHQMGQPPITVVDSYPPEGMFTFKGVVRVIVTIGTNGKVVRSKIAVTSGKRVIDELAMAFCRRWTFKPALDGKGEPMECDKLIRIPFNLPPEKMKDQIDRN